jgi:uncharacterized phage protein (TIGR01671 family)
MRDLKFRAWNTIDKVMITDLNSPKVHHGNLISDWEDALMQFTGLKDRDGVEIYEGDIIQNYFGRVCRVVWHKYAAAFDCEFVKDIGEAPPRGDRSWGFENNQWKSHVKVIGNIYENTELLNDQTN